MTSLEGSERAPEAAHATEHSIDLELASPLGPERIGTYLARQRRLRGISLEELEALTHLPRRSLERLEAGAFDRHPDGFVRGFVRTVAEAIGLDAEDTLSRMIGEPAVEPRRTPLRRWLLPTALVFGLAVSATALSWRSLGSRPAAAPPGVLEVAPALPRPGGPVRRDAVRALAEEQGLALPATGAPEPLASRRDDPDGRTAAPDGGLR